MFRIPSTIRVLFENQAGGRMKKLSRSMELKLIIPDEGASATLAGVESDHDSVPSIQNASTNLDLECFGIPLWNCRTLYNVKANTTARRSR